MKQNIFFTAKVLNWDKSLIHNLILAPQLCRKFYVKGEKVPLLYSKGLEKRRTKLDSVSDKSAH